jgi:hypothetical protein
MFLNEKGFCYNMAKKPLSIKIGEEVINELITIGISFLLVLFAFNYFNFKYAWIDLLKELGGLAGLNGTAFATELGVMTSSLANTFPLKFIFADYGFGWSILVGILVLAIAILLKYWTNCSKEKWVVDMGRNLYIPAIVAFFCMLLLQIVFAVRAAALLEVGGVSGALFVWQTFGLLFILGIIALLVGSVMKVIARGRKSPKVSLIANTLLNGSVICLVYYAVLRFLTMKWILVGGLGRFVEVFILSGELSVYIILISVFLFTFGRQLRNYGKFLMRVKRRQLYINTNHIVGK